MTVSFSVYVFFFVSILGHSLFLVESWAILLARLPVSTCSTALTEKCNDKEPGRMHASRGTPDIHNLQADADHLFCFGFFLQREEALSLVTTAISAGIFNDLGSRSNVDACVITAQGTEELRNLVKPNERVEKERRYVCRPVLHFCLCSCRHDLTLTSSLHRIHRYTFRRGTTAWKTGNIRDLVVSESVEG
jgi:hypothetical protein